MAWRSWSTTNRCPVCSGFPWSGKSAQQCRGGARDESPEAVYCSNRESTERREKTWLWVLDRPFEWLPEPVDPDPVPIWQRRPTRAPGDLMHPSWIQTGTWDYHDEHGNYAYSVVRFDWRGAPHLLPSTMRPKDYRPGRRFAAGERLYRWGLPAEARVPYRLPFVLGALERRALLWICEGEKACEALVNAAPDETATTMPGGSNSWAVGAPERWLPPETRASVIVDRDEAGRGWAADVQKTLPRASFWQSATLGEGDDVVDHLAAGFGLDELVPMPEGG